MPPDHDPDARHRHGELHEHPSAAETHQHAGSVRPSTGHALSDVFGTHSHDTADQVDEALEADADGRRALLLSLAILLLTSLVQAVVVVLSGSVARTWPHNHQEQPDDHHNQRRHRDDL